MAACGKLDIHGSRELSAYLLFVEWWSAPIGHHSLWCHCDPKRPRYEGAKRAAVATRKKYGANNLGPWTAFEWGMVSGKLSALRWALGDEWDMLDT